MKSARTVVGWDVGGAHLKACLLQNGQVLDVQQWACPLWQGLQHLDAALAQAALRWPALQRAQHAVTMTGEMVDLFANREAGVRGITQRLAQVLHRPLHVYAGAQGWCDGPEVGERWAQVASANWRATAGHVALWAASAASATCTASASAAAASKGEATPPHGVLIDIGSTTTDLIAFANFPVPTGQVLGPSHSDAQRLASGELVYQGVVRTPLCALAQRITLAGTRYNVMNEFFATTADVYRLTGELDAAHDLHPTADGAEKTAAATRQRLARLVGLDATDARAADWLDFAHQWRTQQVAELAGQLQAVCAAYALPAAFPTPLLVVAAGCGAFLAHAVCQAAGLPSDTRVLDYGHDVAPISSQATPGTALRARVCAPSVAVAVLWDQAVLKTSHTPTALVHLAALENNAAQEAWR